MSVEKKVPEIRFKGFSGEWEKYPLATFISSLDAGVSVNSDDRPANENEFGILKTSCVTNGFFEPNENKIVFKTEEISRLKEPVLENTIIISRMNTPALVGANAYISKGYANYFLPDRLWAAKPTSIGDLTFIAYILGSDKGRLALSNLATGTSGSMKNISKPAVLRLELNAPEEKEQTQIGNYFQKLDCLINQHQQKHDKISSIKKAMLEKMFPQQGETMPEIRFNGFSGEWEEKAIFELFTVTRGNVLSANKTSPIPTSNKRYPVYSSQTKNNGLMGFYDKYLFENAITWTTDGANAGTVNFRDGKFYSTNVNGVLLSDEGYANKAIAEILNKEAWRHVSHVGNPKLMNNVMSAIKITIPNSFQEQIAIGNYFQKLDSLINQHQQQITKLNNIKQACLSKMFV